MGIQPLSIFSFPRAIIHVDGDCFFASCEMIKNPSLRGKAVITGVERGIVSSLSYEAKARGVKRGMKLTDVKKICPEVVMIPSDYGTYSLYSLRMYNILRRYTCEVEEYSIDECFADITGLRRPLNMSYEKIAANIKKDLDTELGITFSLGLAPTKVLAKVASKWKKPSGLTIIPGLEIHNFLQDLSIDKIWGVGPQTTAHLNKLGVKTALQYATKEKEWIEKNLTKPHVEIWQELRGELVNNVLTAPKHHYQSISKTKTFTPPSRNYEFVFSQLSKNIENACIKLRRHKLITKKIFFYLKTQEFKYLGTEIELNRATDTAMGIINIVKGLYPKIFDARLDYRATGIILLDLHENNTIQLDLFSNVLKVEKISKLFGSIDNLAERYGKHTLFLGSSLKAMVGRQHSGARQKLASRKENLFKGETFRKRIGIPFCGEVI